MPVNNDCMAAIIAKPLTIRVGNFGTRPVSIYSTATGTNRTIDISAKNIAISVKNPNG